MQNWNFFCLIEQILQKIEKDANEIILKQNLNKTYNKTIFLKKNKYKIGTKESKENSP